MQAAAGAKGQTLSEMLKTLEMENIQDVHSRLFALTQCFKTNTDVTLSVANAAWISTKFSLKQEYINFLIQTYKSQPYSADFGNPSARNEINKWVETATNSMIPELIKDGVLTPLTVLVLVSALYFKGNWATAFDPQKTKPMPFYLRDGSTVSVPMMNVKANFNYQETSTYKYIEIPYTGGSTCMAIVLPTSPNDLDQLGTASSLIEVFSKHISAPATKEV